jgi:hypothetical protein
MSGRDEFSAVTKRLLAGRTGYLCSHPDCRRSTIGPAVGGAGIVSTGEAAHITAAASGGPRYDPALSPDERKNPDNGIWLCEVHAKQVDSDEPYFTVELLRQWKNKAERAAFDSLTRGVARLPTVLDELEFEEGLLRRLGLLEADIEDLGTRIQTAAKIDIAAAKRAPGWPSHVIGLGLKSSTSESEILDIPSCARGIEATGGLVVVAPPGTGKTTTAVLLAETILNSSSRTAVFVSLNEWSTGSVSMLQSLSHRAAFRGFREEDFMFLAMHGRLALVLDGWNELDGASRKPAILELKKMQREFPLLVLAVTTRRQALDVPVLGPVIEIEPLSEGQQLELARSVGPSKGEALLDHARRISGLRELVAIPLYLSSLLQNVSGGELPTTKEEVLRLFIREHEQAPETVEVLRQCLDHRHEDVLRALAIEATRRATTSLQEADARSIVSRVAGRLKAAGQIGREWEPREVLDLLVNHHTLVRREGAKAVSFQHQQIQEWYASEEVETSIKHAAAGNAAEKARLRSTILDMPAWEEAVLFACERISRAGTSGEEAVAACVLESLTIDPILAAEMIYRSSAAVWSKIESSVLRFIEGWHNPARVDRAVVFMVTSGRPEFAQLIWPLVSHRDNQICLQALRAARRFRAAVLGTDARTRLCELPDERRGAVLVEIVQNSGPDGIQLAAEVAAHDPSKSVMAEVIRSLHFRGSNRLVRDLLAIAPEAVWELLTRDRFPSEGFARETSARLKGLRDKVIAQERDPLKQLGLLLEERVSPDIAAAVSHTFETADFGVLGPDAGWTLTRVCELYPREISVALIRRLESGRGIPVHCERLLTTVELIDGGPLRKMVVSGVPAQVAASGVVIAGPETVGSLIEKLLALRNFAAAKERRSTRQENQEYERIVELVSKTRPSAFVAAWLGFTDGAEPVRIASLCDLLARHGDRGSEQKIFPIDDSNRERLGTVLARWADALLASPASKRGQYATLARAATRIGVSGLIEPLSRLLAADLAQWRAAREALANARQQGSAETISDARTAYTLDYHRAFVSIGGDRVAEIMRRYLRDRHFGVNAAGVLKAICERRSAAMVSQEPRRTVMDFGRMVARRLERRSGVLVSSTEGDAILDAVAQLLKSEASEGDRLLAVSLAMIGMTLPHGARAELLVSLLAMKAPNSTRRVLLTAVALSGEVVSANFILESIRDWLAHSRDRKRDIWELEEWLILLLFSDQPEKVVEGVDLAGKLGRAIVRNSLTVLEALEKAPVEEFESIWFGLLRLDPRLLSSHGWIRVLLARGGPGVWMHVLDVLCNPQFAGAVRKDTEMSWIARLFARQLSIHPDLRAELLRRYDDPRAASNHPWIESCFASSPDAASILAMVRRYADGGRAFHYYPLSMAIESLVVKRRAVPNWENTSEMHGVDASGLRKQLFAMTQVEGALATVARASLAMIDALRDEHGRPGEEARHPDISTGRPWPFVQMGDRGNLSSSN